MTQVFECIFFIVPLGKGYSIKSGLEKSTGWGKIGQKKWYRGSDFGTREYKGEKSQFWNRGGTKMSSAPSTLFNGIALTA